MIIQLPLENWADLLPLVPRLQLVEIVKQLGDRQFANILQFFLTEVGQITLDHLRIVAPRENDPNGDGGPSVKVCRPWPMPWHAAWDPQTPIYLDLETNLPEGPMPKNIRDFQLIELSYFDPSVANFLRQFKQQEQQPGKSLLDNVNLCFSSSFSPLDDNTIMIILAQLMPMIGNINSMSICNLRHNGFGCIGFVFGPNITASTAQLLTTIFTNARILEIDDDMHWSTFYWCNWLYAPRNDGKPRALRLRDSFPHICTKNLTEQIKKDFLKSKATRPVNFFVYIRAAFRDGNIQDICLDNDKTNERLVVKTSNPPPNYPYPKKFVLISRYPMGANQEWIEANEQEVVEWNFDDQNRRIRFALE